MIRTPLIIDCDPGVDDAIALLLAFASPDELEIIAVTTVAGNVGPVLTARNARLIRQLAGRADVPIHAGAESPVFREALEAGEFHGPTGLGWMEVFEPDLALAEGHAVNAIITAVMSRPVGEVTLAVTGPMTNVALAMRMEPRLVERLGPIVIMGGARSAGGNTTASAEYNIIADPHAAQIVFSSGCQVVAIGLDATYQVRITPKELAAAKAIDTPAGQALHSLFAFACHAEEIGGVGAECPLHDPCTIAYLLAPELFTTVPVDLQVETSSPLTLGHTAVQFRLENPQAATVRWATEIDGDGLFAMLLERIARL